MKLLILILKHYELVDIINRNLAAIGIKGSTTIDGVGMSHSLINMEELPFMSILKSALLEESKDGCKVMLFAVNESDLEEAKSTIKRIVGDFKKPNTGIMFSLPIDDFEGLKEY